MCNDINGNNQSKINKFEMFISQRTHLSIDIATKLNIDDVEQITSIAI